MPRDNEAPGGTRSLHRVELAAKLAVRDASATKGGMLSNFYEERTPKITRIVKRPGVEPAGVVGSGCGGQGFTEFNGSLLTVACDTLYQQHMIGLHAIVTTAHFPPGDVTENTGAGRYKFKFSPEQCSGEHVWSDPCDEDRESGEIDMEEVTILLILGGREGAANAVYSLDPASGAFTKLSPDFSASLAIDSAASGQTSFAVALSGGIFRVYDKSWVQLSTTTFGASLQNVRYLNNSYYFAFVGIPARIYKYNEAGAQVTFIAATQDTILATDENSAIVAATGQGSGTYATITFYNESLVSTGSWDTPVVANGYFVNGLAVTTTHVYVSTEQVDGSSNAHWIVEKYTRAGVFVSSVESTVTQPSGLGDIGGGLTVVNTEVFANKISTLDSINNILRYDASLSLIQTYSPAVTFLKSDLNWKRF